MTAVVSNIAIVFCFAPFLILLWRKLRYERIYTLIGLYWLVTALLNQYHWVGNAQNWTAQAYVCQKPDRGPFCHVFIYFELTGDKEKADPIFLLYPL